MTTSLAARTPTADAIEQVLIGGDLSRLTSEQRVAYYNRVCDSLGLNPLTKPFAYLKLNGKEILYALRDAAEQLRKIHGVSIVAIESAHIGDVFVVTAKAQDKTGRTDASTGAVSLVGLKGEALANGLMKAETKAKRRVTLSICGLGMLDETEVETIQPQGYTVTAPTSHSRVEEVVHSSVRPAALSSERSEDAGSNPAPATTPADGALRIMRITVSDTKNKNVKKHTIILSDGRETTTINSQLAALCEQLVQSGDPVTVDTKSTKWGEDLLAVHRVSAPLPVIQLRDDLAVHGEMVSADDIPFVWLIALVAPLLGVLLS